MAERRARDRAATEERFRGAVEALLVRGGFAAVTPAAVAAEAGADKMLIYRYFGGLEGLMLAVVRQPGFFPDVGALLGPERAALLALAPAPRLRRVMAAYVQALAASPTALELMAWEMVERNALTAVAETAREEAGRALIGGLFADVQPRVAAEIASLMVAGLTYLLLRRRKIRTYNGLDLTRDETWVALLDQVEAAATGMLRAGEEE